MKTLSIICAVLLILPCIALAAIIPDTGQTKCYDNSVEIPCPSPGEDFYGQDAQYGPNLQSYTKLDANGNDLPDEATEWVMVRDNVTGLIWENKTDDGSIHDKNNIYNWYDAQDVFIAALNAENFGGHSDWRLPTVKELASIVNSDTYNPSINTTYFPNTVLFYYWSSTTIAYYPYYPNGAWVVGFGLGGMYGDFKSHGSFYVRAVRAGQCGSFGDFIDNGDGTVTGTNTRLMWQKDTSPGFYTWQEALSHCENLTLAGYNDWRLPNANELQSLVDYNRYHPSINTDYFPSTQSSNYWSSTTYAYSLNNACVVNFSDGYVHYGNKSHGSFYVRAVRGGQCGSLGDCDGDGILDDGDISGIIGDNPCTGGQTANCDDNCPSTSNPGQEDTDSDEVGDACDNCPNSSNPGQNDLDHDCVGDLCDGCPYDPENDIDNDEICGDIDNCPNTYNPDQLDSYPPQGNGIGDACECEGNFKCSEDQNVDGLDAAMFKFHFGRSLISYPCTDLDPCRGDFSCNGNVDGLDAALFKSDFGRSGINNPCPICVSSEPWCQYE